MRRSLVACALLALAVAVAARAPQATDDAPFFFLQFSDPQFGMFTPDKHFAQETANFEFAIAEYLRLAARLDRTIPLHNVPGNHDVENTPTSGMRVVTVRSSGITHRFYELRELPDSIDVLNSRGGGQ